ncbi:MAG: hypothetical protein K2J32_02835 [Ruminococcus sp.]|nr:hypothetical protein [Ruminococcus sp.]
MKRELIKNISANLPDGSILEGNFTSRIFRNENSAEMLIYFNSLDYAEDCIAHFNSMPDDMIDEICHGLIESCQEDYSVNKDFKLPEPENIRNILNYCRFNTMTVYKMKNDSINYAVSGESDWRKFVGFVIKDGTLVYVGFEYEEYLYHDDMDKYL